MKNNLKILNVLIILTALAISLLLIISACSSRLIQPDNEQSNNENTENIESSNQGDSGENGAVSGSESSIANENSDEIIDGSESSSDNSNNNQETGNKNFLQTAKVLYGQPHRLSIRLQ